MTTLSQRSFSGGEIAPALYQRVDTAKYAFGLRTLRNFYVMRHGGAANRPGSQYIAEVKDSSKDTRMIPFVFNTDQTYILEFGDQYMRVIRNGAQVTNTAQNITAITNANPAVLTYSGTDNYANGDEVYISGVVGDIGQYVNGRNFKVANVNTGANTFELDYLDGTNVNSTTWGSYTSGGTIAEIYAITTPYLEADLFNLQFCQSADVITIVHPSYAPRELTRSGHNAWALNTISFAPGIAAPSAGLSGTQNGTTGSTTYKYVITSIAEETYEESLSSSTITVSNGNATLSTTNNISLAWTAVSGAQEYNVYKETYGGIYGFIGVAGTNAFTDIGIDADESDTPPVARNPFNATDDYPSTVTYIQQRLTFANTNNDPEKIWMSRTGFFNNFTISSPLQDDDAVTFAVAGRQVNSVKHLLDLGGMVILTASAEISAQGSQSSAITPTNPPNIKFNSYNGSSNVPPINVGNNALFIQGRGAIVRDLGFDFEVEGYRGGDLTIYSSHLVDGHEIISWAYQQIPHSIVWAVRDDGVLLGLTYVREQAMLAWHRHDFGDGFVNDVCVIPEGSEDRVYVIVERTINAKTVQYIERLSVRDQTDVKDYTFIDSYLSYDGRNTTAQTMTLSGGTNWTYDETLTLTSSTSYFSASEVGNSIHLTGTDGTIIRCEITAYTSATVVSVQPHKTVPVAMRSVAITDWSRAVDTISGLWHLEGESVSVFADGFVVSSPNNDSYEVVAVANGRITLSQSYAVIHIGLPITADIEPLDIDTGSGETMVERNKLINQVTLYVESSRGGFVGAKPPSDDTVDPLEGLTEFKMRNDENYDESIGLRTGKHDVIIESRWNSNGRVFIRQVDPLPLKILSIAPAGAIPFRR